MTCIAIPRTVTWEMISPADSTESLSRTPSSLQQSPASSLHTTRVASSSSPRDDPDTNATVAEETRSESEFLFLPDYLVLSNCKSGRLQHTRYAYAGDSVQTGSPTMNPLFTTRSPPPHVAPGSEMCSGYRGMSPFSVGMFSSRCVLTSLLPLQKMGTDHCQPL